MGRVTWPFSLGFFLEILTPMCSRTVVPNHWGWSLRSFLQPLVKQGNKVGLSQHYFIPFTMPSFILDPVLPLRGSKMPPSCMNWWWKWLVAGVFIYSLMPSLDQRKSCQPNLLFKIFPEDLQALSGKHLGHITLGRARDSSAFLHEASRIGALRWLTSSKCWWYPRPSAPEWPLGSLPCGHTVCSKVTETQLGLA